jgi:hypothetical protein
MLDFLASRRPPRIRIRTAAMIPKNSEPLLMTPEEWKEKCADISKHMTQYVADFVTPISVSEDSDYGYAWGTGTYVSGLSQPWILTAEHVAAGPKDAAALGHLPVKGDYYHLVSGTGPASAYPIDGALLPIGSSSMPATNRIVPSHLISASFSAVTDEILFWFGYPGFAVNRHDPMSPAKRRAVLFETLNVPSFPMAGQLLASAKISHCAFDPTFHVGVHYPHSVFRAQDSELIDSAKANGMSGSALWDTKYVATMRNKGQWRPDLAEICGVVWGALDDPEIVLATKIECIRAAFAAYL